MQSMTSFDIVMEDQTEPLTFYVKNTLTDDLEDVFGTSSFTLVDIDNADLKDSGTFTANGGTKIANPGTGIYQYNFDSSTYSAPNGYVFSARCVLENESVNHRIFVKASSPRYFAYAAQLRIQVDKARKSISDQLVNIDRYDRDGADAPPLHFFYGYSDAHMCFYLDRGVQYLNAIPPYTAFTVDQFPFSTYGTILIDAATIAALESQGIFAIDTDYNAAIGGNSLVIDHFSKLSSMISSILGRFQKTAISWKQQYRSKGLVMFQFMPGGVRAARQLNALPRGFWSRMLSQVYS